MCSRHGNKADCFISTAVYGSPYENEVFLLRRYRDIVLKKNLLGRIFIKLYYKISPYIATIIKRNKLCKNASYKIVNNIVDKIKTHPKLTNESTDIIIQYNTGCNLNCKLCSIEHDTKENNKHIPEEVLLSFLNRLNNYNSIEWIVWIGRGELFLDNEFVNIINLISELYPNIIHTVITNGNYIDNLVKIKYPNKINLQVSLDGLKDVHEYNRGIGSFDLTVNFIKKALEMNFNRLTVRTISTKNLILQINDFSKYIKNLSKDIIIYLQELISPHNNIDLNNYIISKKEIELAIGNISNNNILVEDKDKNSYKKISLLYEGIYNCDKPVCKIGNYSDDIEIIIENYNNSILHCKECYNKKNSCEILT